jgi:hypothetical protein
LLAVLYYFGFDLQWGVTHTALTWGLPLVIASLLALTAGLLALNRKSIRWGIVGLGATVIVFIYYGIILFSFSYVLLLPDGVIEQTNTYPEQNNIIALALSDRFNNGGYTVINPETTIPDITSDRIDAQLSKQNYDFTNLLSTLFKINRTPVKLNLKSSPREGYYMDYNGMFSRYIDKHGGGWLRWRVFHPQVSGYTQVSLPAYDPQSGYVLIYMQHTRNSRFFGGGSDIFAYQYKNGELTFIDVVNVSIQ